MIRVSDQVATASPSVHELWVRPPEACSVTVMQSPYGSVLRLTVQQGSLWSIVCPFRLAKQTILLSFLDFSETCQIFWKILKIFGTFQKYSGNFQDEKIELPENAQNGVPLLE